MAKMDFFSILLARLSIALPTLLIQPTSDNPGLSRHLASRRNALSSYPYATLHHRDPPSTFC